MYVVVYFCVAATIEAEVLAHNVVSSVGRTVYPHRGVLGILPSGGAESEDHKEPKVKVDSCSRDNSRREREELILEDFARWCSVGRIALPSQMVYGEGSRM